MDAELAWQLSQPLIVTVNKGRFVPDRQADMDQPGKA